jgi:hypothetical protein
MLDLHLDSISELEFNQTFNTEEKCLEYLAQKKWTNGFVCRKCNNTNYCIGKSSFSRRCTRCKHEESARVDTIFEGCRFDLTKAFYIAYTVCHTKGDSSHELSRKLNLRQMTCWTFKKKLSECIKERQDISPDIKVKLEEIVLRK